ncbi:MAG: radical SAM protein [Proteobacteria bacterium]|nr:radical SAM protein [Pseudomonadota bacterium]
MTMRIYGPVPSRRFGLSLGVDIVPLKTCSLDCIYCQLGATDNFCTIPEDFYDVNEVLSDVEEALEDSPQPDVITLAGSGEPTLYRSLESLIGGLRSLADIPILLLSNSSLFWREEVARAVLNTDILAPSLDAGDEETFLKVNKPHLDITFDKVLEGLKRVTHAHPGEIRIEVMLMRGINDDEQSLERIARHLKDMRFDQIDVNTPVRPPVPERGALPCYQDVLDRALEMFGPKARAIGKFKRHPESLDTRPRSFNDLDKDIREILLRRPCTADDIASSLDLDPATVSQSLDRLSDAGFIVSSPSQSGTYFHVPSANPMILKKET